jgi:uncharacterized protein (TIGR03437 family)
MRSLILMSLGLSMCLAQSLPPTPILVGADFSNPFPLTVAPGQLLTLFVQPPAAYYTTEPEPMPTISAVFWNGSDEAMPVLQVQQANTGCAVPSSSGVCPNLLAITVQVPFDAPINPVAGSNIVVRPSGIAVFVSGEKSAYFGAQALADQVHIVTNCDVLFNQAPITHTSPCAPMITHANGTSVSSLIPAVAGEELVVYATGLGQTNPPLTTGQPAAGSSPTVATFSLDFNYRANALATNPGAVGATVATPLYAGATKGYVGLYQINFIVPPTPAGLQPCVDFAAHPATSTGGNAVLSNLTVSVGSMFSFDGAGICVTPTSS